MSFNELMPSRKSEPDPDSFMKLKLHQNSLFAVLMRSPWWLSGLLAAGIFGATRLFMPIELAVFAASPFVVITVYVAWKQLRAPSAKRIAETLERLTAMSREEFTAALEAGWRREGYEVSRSGGPFDLELRREGGGWVGGSAGGKAGRSGGGPPRAS